MNFKNFIYQHKLLPVNLYNHSDISIWVEAGGKKHSCTNNLGLVGLKPLTLAFHQNDVWFNSVNSIRIEKNKILLAELILRPSAFVLNDFALYSIVSSRNYIRNFWQRKIDFLIILLKNKIQSKHKFEMKAAHIVQLFDFCIYPRPVYLLSLSIENKPLCFPIDVVGNYFDNKILVSVRKSNKACSEIINKGRFLLSSVSYDHKNQVYQLGKNLPANLLKDPSLDTQFKFENSLPYPDYSIEVKQLQIIRYIELGEHYCFYCESHTSQTEPSKNQLAHLPWYLVPKAI